MGSTLSQKSYVSVWVPSVQRITGGANMEQYIKRISTPDASAPRDRCVRPPSRVTIKIYPNRLQHSNQANIDLNPLQIEITKKL